MNRTIEKALAAADAVTEPEDYARWAAQTHTNAAFATLLARSVEQELLIKGLLVRMRNLEDRLDAMSQQPRPYPRPPQPIPIPPTIPTPPAVPGQPHQPTPYPHYTYRITAG